MYIQTYFCRIKTAEVGIHKNKILKLVVFLGRYIVFFLFSWSRSYFLFLFLNLSYKFPPLFVVIPGGKPCSIGSGKLVGGGTTTGAAAGLGRFRATPKKNKSSNNRIIKTIFFLLPNPFTEPSYGMVTLVRGSLQGTATSLSNINFKRCCSWKCYFPMIAHFRLLVGWLVL